MRQLMNGLGQSGAFELPRQVLDAILAEFGSGAASEADTAAAINHFYRRNGEIVDPHTAVGLHVAQRQAGSAPMISLATAHPAKFPDAVAAATGIRPALPSRLSHLLKAPERFTVLPNSADAVRDFILAHNKA